MSTSTYPDVMTVQEVAKVFRVSAATVGRWIKDGRLEAIQTPGNSLRIPMPEVDRLMARTKGGAS